MLLSRKSGRTLRLGFLVALSLGALPGGRTRAGENQAPPAPAPAVAYELAYTLKVDPEKPAVTVQGVLAGTGAGAVRKFSGGLAGKLELRISGSPDKLVFDYSVPQVQSVYERADQPALEKEFFAGFADRLLIVPEAEGIRGCRDVRLRLEFPEAWKVATSLGIESHEFVCPSLPDLAGTLICGGDYTVSRFEVAGRDPTKKTAVLVALRGERQIDEARFLSDLKRMIEEQMAFFGGSHPAPRQFIALHFVPPNRGMNIPAFNRRAPAHDTILAFHSSARPQDDFEFLGMLAHEHLHNWYPNVMRSSMGLWFMEGLNDYVAYRGLYVSGLHNATQFAGMLSKWHREYGLCLMRKDSRLMPYRRGMFAGLVFDVELRRASAGKAGLRDALLGLLTDRPAGGVVSKNDLLGTMQRLAGKDFAPLYEDLVARDAAIDLPRYLAGTGLRIADDKAAIRLDPQTDTEKAFSERLFSDK